MVLSGHANNSASHVNSSDKKLPLSFESNDIKFYILNMECP